MSTAETVLRRHWRKVASTDNLLQQAYELDTLPPQQHSTAWTTKARGLCMMLLAAALLAGELAVVVAKLVPRAPHWAWLQALRADSYYVYLVPLMVPMAVVGVTANWFSLKLFKHNS